MKKNIWSWGSSENVKRQKISNPDRKSFSWFLIKAKPIRLWWETRTPNEEIWRNFLVSTYHVLLVDYYFFFCNNVENERPLRQNLLFFLGFFLPIIKVDRLQWKTLLLFYCFPFFILFFFLLATVLESSAIFKSILMIFSENIFFCRCLSASPFIWTQYMFKLFEKKSLPLNT